MSSKQSEFISGLLSFGDKLHFPEFGFILDAKWHPNTRVMLNMVEEADWPYVLSFYKNEKAADAYRRQRIPLWGALAYPDALGDRVFLAMQGVDMTVLMDDHFTHPKSIDDPDALSILEREYGNALDGIRPSDTYPIAQLLHDSMQPILKTLSTCPPARKRIYDATKDLINVLSHPLVHRIEELTFEEYVAIRRIDVFADWTATLIEYALDLDMGDALAESEDLREVRTAAIDAIMFAHDVYSFRKEFSSDEGLNAIWVLARQYQLSVQQAIDRLVELARARERDLIAARDRVLASPLGQRTDVREYMTALEHHHRGSAEFHTFSARYIGLDRQEPFTSGEVTLEPIVMPLHIAGPDFMPNGPL